MSVKPIFSNRNADLDPLVEVANVVSVSTPRTVISQVDTDVTQYPAPFGVDDAVELNGSWASNFPPETVEAGSAKHFFYIGYTKDDPLVRIDSHYTYKKWIPDGLSWKQIDYVEKNGIGDGVTVFGLPNGSDQHSVNTNDPTLPPGQTISAVHTMKYVSGKTLTIRYTYQTDGTPDPKPDDVVIPPPAPPAQEQRQFGALIGDEDQYIKDIESLISFSKEAFANTVGIAEQDFIDNGNPIQATLLELNGIGNMAKQWDDLANDGNAPERLKSVAAHNADWIVRKLLEPSRLAHNTGSAALFAQVDIDFEYYQNYANWAIGQTVQTLTAIN